MAEFAKGRGVRLEVGITYETPVAVQTVSKADPAAIGATAHGLVAGDVAYLADVEGMDEIAGQAIRAGGTVTADAFEADNLDSELFGDFTSGNLIAVGSWATLSQVTDYELGGAAPSTEETTVLLDKKRKVANMLAGEDSVSFTMRALTTDNAALAYVRKVARRLEGAVFRITHPDGAQRIFYGEPSVPGESLSVGAIGTGTMTVAVKGAILNLDPATP